MEADGDDIMTASTAAALSSLAAHACEHGIREVCQWLEDDPGLAFVPSWQFHHFPLRQEHAQ